MPIVILSGACACKVDLLSALREELIQGVISVAELHLTADQVAVDVPFDVLDYAEGVTREVRVKVEGLFVKPERTDEVRQELAKTLGRIVRRRFPEILVECFVQPFDPKKGFWSSADAPAPSPTPIWARVGDGSTGG